MASASQVPNGIDPEEKKKLILCFDGTGNKFMGSNADTNVVKILRKLDRNHPNQFHYYQTGIGTYDINESSVNKGVLGEFRSNISKTIDSGFGTTFDAHVIAGYRFLMRYYETGAKIYIFGFSRGAFTAKFLARMVNKVGLLCKGNEEMVPFAYKLYQLYLQGKTKDREASQCSASHEEVGHAPTTINGSTEHTPLLRQDSMLAGNGPVKQSDATKDALNEIEAFSQTFCRKELNTDGEEENIKVFFLGMWDCVASVAVLERKAPVPTAVTGTAHHVRHAVAVDERRVKFKPALLAQDIKNAINHGHEEHNHNTQEDIKEVWFPGNHGDVGGGWPAFEPVEPEKMSLGRRIINFFTTWRDEKPNLKDDRLQMSDIPLEWMIRQVISVGKEEPDAAVHWCDSLNKFTDLMNDDKKRLQASRGFMHDCLSFGYGTAFFKVCMWKFMEWLPFLTRWELNDRETNGKLLGWEAKTWPPNRASARDIPRGAVLHQSLLDRLEAFPDYKPKNNHGDGSEACLLTDTKITVYDPSKRHSNHHAKFKIHESITVENVGGSREEKKVLEVEKDCPRHQTYDFNRHEAL